MKGSRVQRQVIVRTRRPWLMPFMVILILGSVAAGGRWMFDLGQTHGKTDLVKMRKQVRQQRRALKDLGEQNAECRQLVANLEQSKEIDQLAYAEVERNLREFNTEMADLKEEVAFYRNIVAPSSNERGIKIQSFSLVKMAQEERSYRYKIVLVQVMPSRLIRGNVDLKLIGHTREGTPKNLSLRHMSKKKALGFKFKYFQNLEGKLTFPVGFKPQKVTVKVQLAGKKKKKLSKSYDWKSLNS